MKPYRFSVQCGEDEYLILDCVDDPKLFTQARSMDEALYMARDLVETMYEIKGFVVELVVPPDVVTAFEKRARQRAARRQQSKSDRAKLSRRRTTRAA